MISVADIADRINAMAPELARELLPNGHRSGNKWMASGIADTGLSASLYVHLSGVKIGHWCDMGNAAAGEERGDILDLMRLKLGLDAKGAVDEAKRRLGIHDPFMPHAPRPSPAEVARQAAAARARAEARQAAEAEEFERKAKGARALYLRSGSVPIAGTPAERYLIGRGLDQGDLGWPGALRFNPEVWCKDTGVKEPAMLAPIYNAAGVQIGTHRTWLQRNGGCWEKLAIPKPKKVLGNFWGGFIPINKGSSRKSMRSMPEGEPVYGAEGIEKALAVRIMRPVFRIITTISLPNMGGLLLPPAAKVLVLVCDRDDSETAEGQLARSIAQQQAKGLDVGLVMPPPPFKDIDEWLLAFRAQERVA